MSDSVVLRFVVPIWAEGLAEALSRVNSHVSTARRSGESHSLVIIEGGVPAALSIGETLEGSIVGQALEFSRVPFDVSTHGNDLLEPSRLQHRDTMTSTMRHSVTFAQAISLLERVRQNAGDPLDLLDVAVEIGDHMLPQAESVEQLGAASPDEAVQCLMLRAVGQSVEGKPRQGLSDVWYLPPVKFLREQLGVD